MTFREAYLSRFTPSAQLTPLFAPDLGIWYQWQKEHNLLPPEWKERSLDDIYRALSTPIWKLVRPWSVESHSTTVTSEVADGQRITTIEAGGRRLTSRWKRGPDGDWWQTEYPVKSTDDLDALLTYVESRSFMIDLAPVESACAEVGDEGIVVVDLPSRPFSWLMLEMLGWSEGLMLLLDSEEIVRSIVEVAELQLQEVVSRLVGCAAPLFYSPDNLDGQFVSPSCFADYLSASYGASARTLHELGKKLMVHAGGPVNSLLGALSGCGIDAVTGICAPPQGDTSLAAAREKAGENLVLVGGIAQDYLLKALPDAEFERALNQAHEDATADQRLIISIADHVPTGAEIGRLRSAATRFRP